MKKFGDLVFRSDSYFTKGVSINHAITDIAIYKAKGKIGSVRIIVIIGNDEFKTNEEFWGLIIISKAFEFSSTNQLNLNLTKYSSANFSNVEQAYNDLVHDLKSKKLEVR